MEIHSIGDAFGGQLLGVEELEHRSGILGKIGEAGLERLELLLPGVTRPPADLVESGVEMGDHRFLALDGKSLRSSVVGEDVVPGDASQPGPEGTIVVEAIEIPPGGDEGLLLEILDRGGVLHEGPKEREEHGCVFPDEDLEGCVLSVHVVDGVAPGPRGFLRPNEAGGDAISAIRPDRYDSMMDTDPQQPFHATTIACVRDRDSVAMAGDGQVTLGAAVAKSSACKVRRLPSLGRDRAGVLLGFAGGAADAFALMERFEAKLKATPTNLLRATTELARDWRVDRALRRLEAMMIVADAGTTLLVSGQGDLIEPDDGLVAIGSGGHHALAAARALSRHTELPAERIATESLLIASEICVYTNDHITTEVIGGGD